MSQAFGGAFDGPHIMADQPGSQPQASSLETSTSTGDVGPLMQWVRDSPYSLEEIGMILDALYIVLFGVLFYLEVRN